MPQPSVRKKGFTRLGQLSASCQSRGILGRAPQLGVEEFEIPVTAESGVQGMDSLQPLSCAGCCCGGLVGKSTCFLQPPWRYSSASAMPCMAPAEGSCPTRTATKQGVRMPASEAHLPLAGDNLVTHQRQGLSWGVWCSVPGILKKQVL